MIKKIISLVVAAAQIFALTTGALAADEKYFEGQMSIGDWTFVANKGTMVTYEITDENGYQGKSMHITKKLGTTPNVLAVLWKNVNCKADTTYRYSLAIKAKEAKDIFTNLSYQDRQELNPAGNTFDWMELSFDWHNSGGDTTKEFRISLDGSFRDLWIDNVKFCEVLPDGTLGPNQIKNWDFEGGTTATKTKSKYALENDRNDIVNAGKGSTEKLLATISLDTNIPVFKSETEIVADGDISEWKDEYTPVIIPSSDTQYSELKEYSGEKDCSGKFKVSYDDEYYYVCGTVTDDKFSDNSINMWDQDSIQINFGKKGTTDYYGYGLKYTPEGGMISTNSGDAEDTKLIKYGVTKADETHYVYEAAFPKSIFYNGDSEDLTFNVLINDNDGDGRAAYIQWKYGIGEGAGSAQYGKMIFLDKNQKLFGWYQKSLDTIEADVEYEAPLWIVSLADKAMEVTVTDAKGGSIVTVPANSAVLKNVTVKSEETGAVKVGANLKYGDEEYFADMLVTAELNTDYYIQKYKTLEETLLPEIETLLEQCNEQGISCEYEKSDLWVIEKFLVYGVDDAENNYKPRSEYVYNCLLKICNDLIETLKGYLDGSITPKQPVRYATSTVEIDGQSFVAEDENGSKHPIFFMGYGHFSNAVDTIPEFPDLGVNIIQSEFGPSDIITGENEDGFIVDTAKLDSVINSRLKRGYDNNVQICLLVSPHYIPEWFKQKYPDALGGDSSMFHTGYYDSDPKMKEMLETYLRAVATTIKESPYKEAFNSICLTNETSHAHPAEKDLPIYRQWLSDKFDGDISALNEAYNTSYTGFNVIPYPNVEELTYYPDKEENRVLLPQYADWEDYNDNFVGKFHGWMTDIINEVDPTIATHAKYMQEFDYNEREWRRQFINFGTDPEEISKYCVINGNDANNYYKHDLWGILNKMSYYDLQTSCLRAPVFDTEDHVVQDRDRRYSNDNPYMENHVAADMWQGAIHGRGGSTIWVWERTYDSSSDFSDSILHRPDSLLEASHAMLDVNIFANELTALQNKARTIGILYSETSRVYSLRNSNSLVNAYEGASYLGERIEFVTEKQAASGKLKDNKDINILVVPYSTHVLDGVLEDIKAFADKGGTVVIIGNDSLMYNQYDKPFDENLRNYIFDNSIVIDAVPAEDTRDTFSYPLGKDIWNVLVPLENKYVSDIPVTVTDSVTGNLVWGVNYVAEMVDGDLIVNICDYEYDGGKIVDIRYNGQIIEEGTELRSGKDIMCESIELEPYKPILVSVPADALPESKAEFDDIVNHWARYSIGDLADSGVIKGTSESEFTPQSDVKVSEFAAMLSRAAGKSDDSYLTTVNASPDAKITREQMAHMLVSVYKELKGTLPEYVEHGFTDADNSEYKNDINTAVTLGHITGYSDKTVRPGNTATRAEAAAVIRRFIYSLDHEVNIGKKEEVVKNYDDTLIFFDRKGE